MSVTISQLSNPLGTRIIRDDDADATSENDVLSGAATIIRVKVDNTANGHDVYLKLYNDAAPTVGTTAPNIVIPAKAGKSAILAIQGGSGISFGTALSFACVTTGGTGGTTSPTNSVIVDIEVA